MIIAVAGTGYVGLSIAVLLAQHNTVKAVDIIPEKVELINNKKSPIQDEYIETYLSEKELDLEATLDAEYAYKDADFVVIAAPTNYDSKKNYFDTSAVEAVIRLVMQYIQSQSARKPAVRISFSVRNFCARARRFMTISTRRASSSEQIWMMNDWSKQLIPLPHCYSKALLKRISTLFLWALPKQRLSSCSQIPI